MWILKEERRLTTRRRKELARVSYCVQIEYNDDEVDGRNDYVEGERISSPYSIHTTHILSNSHHFPADLPMSILRCYSILYSFEFQNAAHRQTPYQCHKSRSPPIHYKYFHHSNLSHNPSPPVLLNTQNHHQHSAPYSSPHSPAYHTSQQPGDY